jgi:4,5-dihydroxyphthalate decarboxylase
MEDHSVAIPGVSWETNSDIEFAPERFIATGGADVGENGVRRLVIDLLKGGKGRAIPVYFGRELMQRNLIVRADSDLHHPQDLVGKRVGSRLTIQSGTGAAVLMVLEQAYGIDLKTIDWWMGDPNDLPVNRMDLTMHKSPEDDDGNYEMLMRGELDAVMQTTGPRYRSMFGGYGDHVDNDLAKHPGTRPLIIDPQVMANAYRASGLYPISDVTTIKPELVDQHPALAKQLVDAFTEANARAAQYRSADEQALAVREIQLLGDDPHRYGLGANERKNLAAFIDFLYRLGAIEKAVAPEELFYPSSL